MGSSDVHDPGRLRTDARVRFPGHIAPVTLVQVKPGPFWDFVYRNVEGVLGEITLAEDELHDVQLIDTGDARSFDADPNNFRLGVEARRIRIGFQHDMAALAVSNITPLPHQLEAVYGHFLEQPRLRFLLADDPGAGKTIMTGLYIKELQLRRAADRVLIVTPANLRPQWQRELAERFQIDAVLFDRAVFDSAPTQNPWDVHDFVIVSRDFMRSEEVLAAFVATEKDWDLAVIDEAHGFTLQVDTKGLISKKSERYKAAEQIADRAHRLVLLTATPHSGRNESLWGLLRLLDSDAYGNRCPKRIEFSPRHYSKTSKEQMVDLRGGRLFKPRHPHTVAYDLEGAEWDLYRAVTNFVSRELAEIRGEGNGSSAAGFALTTMQRRLASSVRAISRTLQRRMDRLEKALEDPEQYLRGRREFRDSVLANGDNESRDLTEDERWALEEQALEEWLPQTESELRMELEALEPLVIQAQQTEASGVERKLNELLDVVAEQGLRDDPSKKLLIFTEHKDTLDYLVEKLSGDFDVAVIHGRLKLPERIEAERRFRERAQIMVATEAAGEGINLQFCHLMVNYDIPWNPNRLEQRMGRIHRIGQTQDVHIFNLVASNTREGAVLATLLRKLERMGQSLGDPVFDVIGEIFDGYRLRDLLEDVIAGSVSTADAVNAFGSDPDEFDPATVARARELLDRALATEHIDWQAERDRANRAEERRLPPHYLERFFRDAITYAGGQVADRLDPGTLRVTRTPDVLVARSRVGNATRRVAPEYARLTFEKSVAMRPPGADGDQGAPQAELCGPGHPLFDALLDFVIERTERDLDRGCVFQDPDAGEATLLHVVTGDAVDGNGELVHRALATITETASGYEAARQFLYDLVPAKRAALTGNEPAPEGTVGLVAWARRNVFERRYQQAKVERDEVAAVQDDFLTRSFLAVLARQDQEILSVEEDIENGVIGAEGRLRKAEIAKAQTQERRDHRLAEALRGRTVRRGPVRVLATCLITPHLSRTGEGGASTAPDLGTSNEEVEQIAVQITMAHEHANGAVLVKSVEADNVGFDVLSVRGIQRRCIEVKGRGGVGDVVLTWSEYAKAVELGNDYWLYVVLDCASVNPRLYRVQNPAKALIGSIKPHLDVRFGVAPQPVIDASES
ncbi:helicase-related protein [Nonomuraea sp. NPDC050643]|uniref:helicase-related protein n=1 Tax=Nonomuraea sp. NPDC050643 TaxID=3155660 RepID=UPI0033DA53FC